jgi:hypothetical protein
MKEYAIWSEGYIATGQSSGAWRHGYSKGNSFKEACDNFAAANTEFKTYYNPDRMTFWGCRLFDNQRDAIERFG